MYPSRTPRPALTSSSSGPIQYDSELFEPSIQLVGQVRRSYKYVSLSEPQPYPNDAKSYPETRPIVVSSRNERSSATSGRHGSSNKSHISRKGSAHSDGTIIIEQGRKPDARLIDAQHHLRCKDEEIAALNRHVLELSTRYDQLEQDLQSLQESRFQRMADARYVPMEDSKIQFELESLQSSITRIGKRYANATLREFGAHSQRSVQDLCDAVSDVAHISNISDSPDFLVDLENDAVSVRIIFTALLSWTVHRRFVEDPFWFAHQYHKQDDGDVDWAEFFSDALDHGWRTHTAQANDWRSKTLRHLFPSDGADRAGKRLIDYGERLMTLSAKQVATDFTKGPSSILVSDMSSATAKAYQDELSGLFEKAARLSIMLWRERLAFECHYIHDLAVHRFSIDSRELLAHPRHLLDDPTDHSLDGRRVRVVVHPSVIALGSHEGTRYETGRVLAKAVVCLEEAKDNAGQFATSVGADTDAIALTQPNAATRLRRPPTPPLPAKVPVRTLSEEAAREDEYDSWADSIWPLSRAKKDRKKRRAVGLPKA